MAYIKATNGARGSPVSCGIFKRTLLKAMLDGHDVVKSVAATKKYIRNHINHDSNNHNNNNYVRTYIIKIDKKTATSTSTTTTYLQTNCDKQRYIRVKYSMYIQVCPSQTRNRHRQVVAESAQLPPPICKRILPRAHE